MILLFGLALAVVMVPLLLFLILAGVVGHLVTRRSVRFIIGAAIVAVLLGYASGHHAVLFAAIALGVWQTWRGRRSSRAPQFRFDTPVQRLAPSALDSAWSIAANAARSDPRIAIARARCAELLARAAAEPNDAALMDWANVIQRRVPELVEAASAAAAGVPAPERSALARELADALDRIGAEADSRLATGRLAARDRFDTLRGYVRSRTAPDRDWL